MPITLAQASLDLRRKGGQSSVLLTAPVVVWASPVVADPDDAWVRTASGGSGSRPAAGEALVYPVVKHERKDKNAFALGVTLGRVESNDLCLNDPTVSRFHAWFARDAKTGKWFLTDAESDNGTRVAGTRLAPGAKQVLGDDVTLQFGEVEARFFSPAAFARYVESA